MATGPSLDAAQIEYVRPFQEQGIVRVFGCNDVYRICDYLDVLYACDPHWWKVNLEALKHSCEQKWTQDHKAAKAHKLKRINGRSGKGLSKDRSLIHFGSNSGHQVLNLAWHFGARRFLLLGFNMDIPAGKQQHFFGKHPKPLNQTNNYRGFVSVFRQIQPEIKQVITNCTYPTALDCFAQKPLEEALPRSLLSDTCQIKEVEIEKPYEFLGRPMT